MTKLLIDGREVELEPVFAGLWVRTEQKILQLEDLWAADPLAVGMLKGLRTDLKQRVLSRAQ